MDIEEMMIDYVMDNATQEEIEEFFGYAAYGVCTRAECENNLSQMPDEEFDMFVKKFKKTEREFSVTCIRDESGTDYPSCFL